MTKISRIFLYKDEPGGETGRVVKILCPSGAHVETDQHLFDVETVKASQEIRSTANGILRHGLSEGQEVRYGSVLAEITEDAEVDALPSVELSALPRNMTSSFNGADGHASDTPIVSREAAQILETLGVSPASLGNALITSAIVRQKCIFHEDGSRTGTTSSERGGQCWTALPSHKMQEMAILNGCAGGSYLSMVGIEVIGHAFQRKGQGFFENKILDLVVFESAQLMAEFPNLNGAYRHPGQVEHFKNVVPGVAFNGGGRLVTYAVRPTALSDLAAVQTDILAGFKKYAQNTLGREDCASATYTVTDISASGAEFVLPLVPLSQSCIIGITGNASSGYKAYIAFDHRVTDGFEVANFLKRLRSGIRKNATVPGRVCSYCGVAPNPVDRLTMLLPLQDCDGVTHLCCRQCWR